MLVNTPSAISHMGPTLAEFVELMAAKLAVNVHKDKLAYKDIPILLDRLAEEVTEFRDEVAALQGRPISELQSNAPEELADVGNFCFLLYQFLRSQGMKSATERFLDEFYDIRPEEGRIYCKKTRSGSPVKVGEEVTGTVRNGRVYIRAQHAITGATVSLPRANIIWWKAKGEWPIGKLSYKVDADNRVPPRGIVLNTHIPTSKDAIWNLVAEEPKSNGRPPFVSQYRPKGREDSPNFGKWVYQRRHAFRLVRCGYYDTPEEAATQGLKDWKEKTRV